jgi:hypothetical protein
MNPALVADISPFETALVSGSLAVAACFVVGAVILCGMWIAGRLRSDPVKTPGNGTRTNEP